MEKLVAKPSVGDRMLARVSNKSGFSNGGSRFSQYGLVKAKAPPMDRVPIDGGPPADIMENPGESIVGHVAISPDGKLLAFPYDVASPEPSLKIGVIPVAGGPAGESSRCTKWHRRARLVA